MGNYLKVIFRNHPCGFLLRMDTGKLFCLWTGSGSNGFSAADSFIFS